jgi:hypothetical protein
LLCRGRRVTRHSPTFANLRAEMKRSLTANAALVCRCRSIVRTCLMPSSKRNNAGDGQFRQEQPRRSCLSSRTMLTCAVTVTDNNKKKYICTGVRPDLRGARLRRYRAAPAHAPLRRCAPPLHSSARCPRRSVATPPGRRAANPLSPCHVHAQFPWGCGELHHLAPSNNLA